MADALETLKTLILITGGTFDKSYNVVRESFTFEGGTSLVDLIGRCYLNECRISQLMLIDSLDMDPAQRLEICTAIKDAREKSIVIIHGTSTMLETGKYLSGMKELKDRTIVLTGALKPMRYDSAEASCNFGAALTAARYFESGVYVAMHGLVEQPQKLRKDIDTGHFVFALSHPN
jgi:L-asparaginase